MLRMRRNIRVVQVRNQSPISIILKIRIILVKSIHIFHFSHKAKSYFIRLTTQQRSLKLICHLIGQIKVELNFCLIRNNL